MSNKIFTPRTISRNRLQRLCSRSRWPCDSALLLYGTNRLGWKTTSGRGFSKDPEEWPEAVEARTDSFSGEPYLGPLGAASYKGPANQII